MQGIANAAYLEGFPFPALLRVAPYCAPGGIRVVSNHPQIRVTSPFMFSLLSVRIGRALPSPRTASSPWQRSLPRVEMRTFAERFEGFVRAHACGLQQVEWPSSGSGRRARWSPGRCSFRAQPLLPLRPRARSRGHRAGDPAAPGTRRGPPPQGLAPGSPRRALQGRLLFSRTSVTAARASTRVLRTARSSWSAATA